MRTDAKTARKIGALYFDEETILEVKQLGGGGSGVGGANGLNARNLVTGEDTGEVIAQQAGQIEQQGEQIDALTAQNTELQAENTQLQTENAELTEQLALAFIPIGPSLTIASSIASSSEHAGKEAFIAAATEITNMNAAQNSVSYSLGSGAFFPTIGRVLARGALPANAVIMSIRVPSGVNVTLNSAFTGCCRLVTGVFSQIPNYIQDRVVVTDPATFANITERNIITLS